MAETQSLNDDFEGMVKHLNADLLEAPLIAFQEKMQDTENLFREFHSGDPTAITRIPVAHTIKFFRKSPVVSMTKGPFL